MYVKETCIFPANWSIFDIILFLPVIITKVDPLLSFTAFLFEA